MTTEINEFDAARERLQEVATPFELEWTEVDGKCVLSPVIKPKPVHPIAPVPASYAAQLEVVGELADLLAGMMRDSAPTDDLTHWNLYNIDRLVEAIGAQTRRPKGALITVIRANTEALEQMKDDWAAHVRPEENMLPKFLYEVKRLMRIIQDYHR